MADKKAESAKSEKPTESAVKMVERDDNHSSWLNLVAEYVQEIKPHVLDLGDKELGVEDVRYILNFLSDSQVTELNLERNCLTNGMAVLSSLFTKTKITKLNVSQCGLTKEDLLQLVEDLNKSQITDLDVTSNKGSNLSFEEGLKYVSHLKRSKLTTFNADFFKRLAPIEVAPLFQEFLSSTITNLDLTGSKLGLSDFNFLFASLEKSSVTDFNLQGTKIASGALEELSRRLAATKIEKLDLGKNNLKNADLEVLAAGLINSKVIDLDLKLNLFSNLGPLFTRLKDTQIRKLNLRYNGGLKEEKFMYPDYLRSSSLTSLDLRNCDLEDEARRNLIDSLRFSKVTRLDISDMNWLRPNLNPYSLTVNKFVKRADDLSLTDLDLSQSLIYRESILFKLGKCLKRSRLNRLALNNMRSLHAVPICCLVSFLGLTKGSSVDHIELNSYFVMIPKSDRDNHHCLHPFVLKQNLLASTTFTELELASKEIRDNASVLINYLKYSSVTHLNLADNGIKDNSAQALVELLRKTDLVRLNLNKNLITSKGAKALAVEFKNSRIQYLHLNGNKIDNDGLRFLADKAKYTFITVLDVALNPGDNVMQVEEVLWRNKTVVPRLIRIFHQIAPRTADDEFHFDQNLDCSNISGFLKECLWFYKTVIEISHIMNVLEVRNAPLSREQLFNMVSEKFSLQFTQFIAVSVDADLETHVNILKQAEEMVLIAIVKDFLYNREAYVLDKEKNILHPYVYKLLRKYSLPICGPLDPDGRAKIIAYFTEHLHIEGSEDVIALLRDV